MRELSSCAAPNEPYLSVAGQSQGYGWHLVHVVLLCAAPNEPFLSRGSRRGATQDYAWKLGGLVGVVHGGVKYSVAKGVCIAVVVKVWCAVRVQGDLTCSQHVAVGQAAC